MAAALRAILASAVNINGLPHPSGTDSTQFTNRILTIVFSIAASTALLVIVINGFRYIAARGDPQGTASARNGLVYAVVGLLVVMAAYGIVAFAIRAVV